MPFPRNYEKVRVACFVQACCSSSSASFVEMFRRLSFFSSTSLLILMAGIQRQLLQREEIWFFSGLLLGSVWIVIYWMSEVRLHFSLFTSNPNSISMFSIIPFPILKYSSVLKRLLWAKLDKNHALCFLVLLKRIGMYVFCHSTKQIIIYFVTFQTNYS